MKKDKLNRPAIVYSTDPNFTGFDTENTEQPSVIKPAEQKLKVRLETKHRAGKAVTLVEGFYGSDAEKETLGKNLKTYCGTGGSVKDGEIIIQGDNRDKVMQWLMKNGYKQVKKI